MLNERSVVGRWIKLSCHFRRVPCLAILTILDERPARRSEILFRQILAQYDAETIAEIKLVLGVIEAGEALSHRLSVPQSGKRPVSISTAGSEAYLRSS